MDIELKVIGIVLSGGLVEITLPGERKIDLAATGAKGGQIKRYGVAAGLVGDLKLIGAVADGPQIAVADGSTAREFKSDTHRVIHLDEGADGFKRKGRLTAVILVAADHYEDGHDQCQQQTGYQEGSGFHETDLIATNLPNFVEKGLILAGPIGLF